MVPVRERLQPYYKQLTVLGVVSARSNRQTLCCWRDGALISCCSHALALLASECGCAQCYGPRSVPLRDIYHLGRRETSDCAMTLWASRRRLSAGLLGWPRAQAASARFRAAGNALGWFCSELEQSKRLRIFLRERETFLCIF